MSDIRDDIEAALKDQEANADEPNTGVTGDDASDEGDDGADDSTDDAPAAKKSGEEGEEEGGDKGTDGDAKDPEPSKEKDAPEGDAPGTWNPEKAPTSWSPKIREKWGQLPEDVRKEIVRREEASVVGVRKLQEEFQPVRQFAERLTPVIQEARALGQDPGQYITNLAIAERGLRDNDPNQKFNALLNIADQYGIPLRQYLGGEAPKVQPQQATVPPAVQQELEAIRKWREEQENNNLLSQVAAFSQGKEFFEDVREQMANLLDSGVAKDLQEAYDTACWANPEVREVMLARQSAEKQKGAQTERRAKASAASVKGGSAPEVTVDTDDDDSTEALVRKAMAAQTGRV